MTDALHGKVRNLGIRFESLAGVENPRRRILGSGPELVSSVYRREGAQFTHN